MSELIDKVLLRLVSNRLEYALGEMDDANNYLASALNNMTLTQKDKIHHVEVGKEKVGAAVSGLEELQSALLGELSRDDDEC